MFSIKNIRALGFLSFFIFIGFAQSSDHFIFNRSDMIIPVRWTRGCSPTAASMVLNYYDHLTPLGKLTVDGKRFGKLVDFWARHWDSGWNVPQWTIDDLHVAMGTDDSGNSNRNNIHTGIQTFANSYNGYNFTSSQIGSSIWPWSEGWDWCWGAITAEINGNRPFVWSVGAYDNNGNWLGHSLCAIGYTDAKEVITYNTWSTALDYWYYNQYDDTWNAEWTQVDKVWPGGGSDSDFYLDDPVGGETLSGGSSYSIWWYQFGTGISNVDIYYSINQGDSWTYITTVSSSSGWNYYSWTVPNITTYGARIRLYAYDASSTYVAGDGSPNNFTIICTSPFSPAIISYPSTDCDGNFTVSWNSVSLATSYELQRATNAGFSDAITVYNGSLTSWNQSGLSVGTYYYRVRASNGCGTSGWKNGGMISVVTIPSNPTTISYPSSDCDGNFTVSWSSVSLATSYELQRATNAGFSDAITVYNGSSSFWNEMGLPVGTYYYRVRASNICGAGNWSPGAAISVVTVPAIPSSISYPSLDCDGNFTVSWSSVSLATSYELQRANNPSFNAALVIYSGTSTSWNETGLSVGTYYYRVRANNSCGPGGWRDGVAISVSAIPAAPSVISYPSSDCDGNFTVSWSSVSLAASYELQRATNSGFSDAITVYNGSSTSWGQSGLPVGTYYYRVRASNTCGTGNWSYGAAMSVITAPAAPSMISYPSLDCDGNFTVSWSSVSSATSYELQRANNPSFSPALVVYSGSSTSWNETGLSIGTYYYRVRASNSCGPSIWSSSAVITINSIPSLPTNPNPPHGAFGQSITPTLTWISTYASSYDVYFGTSSPPPKVTPIPISNPSYQPGILNYGTTYYWKIVAINSCGSIEGSVWAFATTFPPVIIPTVTTSPVSSITSISAQSGGNVTSDGGGTITERGVCWSISANPTISDSHTHDGSGTGIFMSNMTGLNPSQTYHVRAYATNSAGTGYGNDILFTTNAAVPGVKNDFNGDGKEDILWRYYGGGTAQGQNYVWYMNGVTVTGGVLLPTISDTSWQIAGTGDFNGDGKVDILWRYLGAGAAQGQNYVWYMDGVTVTGGALLPTISDTNWQIGTTGDFNGDGKVDILWRYYGGGAAQGQNYVWYMDGVTVTGGVLLPTISDLSWYIGGTGDFNGDGKVDILWRNYGSGLNYVWYMDGVTCTGGVLLTTISDLSWYIGGTGDFNGDGKVDILWRNYSSGLNYVWYMNGVTVTGGELLVPITDLNWRIVNR